MHGETYDFEPIKSPITKQQVMQVLETARADLEKIVVDSAADDSKQVNSLQYMLADILYDLDFNNPFTLMDAAAAHDRYY